MRRATIAVAAVALLAPALAASASASSPAPEQLPASPAAASGAAASGSGGQPVPANYTLTSRFNGDIASFRGWQIEWEVPALSSPTPDTSGAIGQWYWNLETGIYYWANNWYVYWYSDNDGTTGDNFTDCIPIWEDAGGGWCWSLLANPGQHITFTYEYCNAAKAFDVNGIYLCAYVNMNNGTGQKFLAMDTRTNPDGSSVTKEMYAHDVESFPSAGSPDEMRIPCSSPTKMVSQKVRWGGGPFQTLQTTNWKLSVAADVNYFYDFQNINLTAATPTWQSCSPPPPVCTPPNPYWDPSAIYNSPNVVAWNRHRYQAKWWTQGEIPGTGAAWQDLGSC